MSSPEVGKKKGLGLCYTEDSLVVEVARKTLRNAAEPLSMLELAGSIPMRQFGNTLRGRRQIITALVHQGFLSSPSPLMVWLVGDVPYAKAATQPVVPATPKRPPVQIMTGQEEDGSPFIRVSYFGMVIRAIVNGRIEVSYQ